MFICKKDFREITIQCELHKNEYSVCSFFEHTAKNGKNITTKFSKKLK